jgi:hypothetical protein
MDTCSGKYIWYKGYTNIPKWREKIMVNRLYNKQVSPKGYKMGGRVKKMGGGKASNFGMLSVKAGIDKNPKPTQADRIAGAKMKNKNA